MKRVHIWTVLALITVGVIAATGAQAGTSLSLKVLSGGTQVGDTAYVNPGDPFTVGVFGTTDFGAHLTMDVALGYDKSDASFHGRDRGAPQTGNLSIVSSEAEILSSIAPAYSAARILQNGSSRETDPLIDGARWYALDVIAARPNDGSSLVWDDAKLFEVTLNNNMVEGDTWYVRIAANSGPTDASWAGVLKSSSLKEFVGYTLTVQSQSSTELPKVGATNKAILDAIMTEAAPKYTWVFWGEVTVVDSDSFTIDDGSGVIINVDAASHGLADGDYVAVSGTVDIDTKTLTSQHVTKY